MTMFGEMDIEIVESANRTCSEGGRQRRHTIEESEEADASEENERDRPHPGALSRTDPVRLYLKEMGAWRC